jgi:hypothetical protein
MAITRNSFVGLMLALLVLGAAAQSPEQGVPVCKLGMGLACSLL